MNLKIISGGQTGVDRAALDAALKHGIECGGWCPAGRLDELGRIPDRYSLTELKETDKEGRSPDRLGGLETAAPWPSKRGSFAKRTLQNVKDSNGTIVIYFDKLRGGSAQTVQFCIEQKRPHQLIDAAKISADDAAKLIDCFVSRLSNPRGPSRLRRSAPADSVVDLVREHKIDILNVAGPRQSEWPGGYDYAFRALDIFLTACKHES